MTRLERIMVRTGKPRRIRWVTVERKARVERPENLKSLPEHRTRRQVRLRLSEAA
ncbi:hypothetical protein [Acuticoccus sediminis]|uniref:hypothetical protein n=1 Tax=Acuticoccus sediminis TaxID=2184697 RepID=UPI001390BF58|nr:hypothetical protein [Acuticoccus sediminis]